MSAPSGAATALPVNILVVDDHPENRLGLRSMLSLPGYRIVEASSGPEALRCLLDEEFAVLLIDVVMPGMSGFELASLIKQRERAATVPILFMTAEAAAVVSIYDGYRVGAVDYLITPLAPEIVRAKVAVFVELYLKTKQVELQAARLLDAEKRAGEATLAELRMASERRFRSLADAVPDIIWTARSDGTVDYFNQRWFERTGGEQRPGTWTVALHPDDVANSAGAWQDALSTGDRLQIECRLRGADGTFRWYLGRAVPEPGSTGEIVSWLGTFTDIEDQKQAQASLAEFKETLDAVLDAVLILDPESLRPVYVNRGASELLGYSRGELEALRATELTVEHDEAHLHALLNTLRETTGHSTVETRCRRKDASELPVEVSLQYIERDGGHVVLIARDISARKQAEREQEILYRASLDAIRARDDFLSIASHEVRTPLTSLQLRIDLLLRSAAAGALPTELAKSKLEAASIQVERMARLISELMDVSKISTGQLRLEPEAVDLSTLARDVVSRFVEEATTANSAIAITPSDPIHGYWDRLRLEQVITNLLNNALKFGAGKPIEVTVASDGAFAHLQVRDHGIGIAPENLERIFHRYERVAPERAASGLGLGLYIIKQIVEAHGGTIHVESKVGEGTRFTVDLPLESPKAA